MRASIQSISPRRGIARNAPRRAPRGALAGAVAVTASALALSLVPGAAQAAPAAPVLADGEVAVTLVVGDKKPVKVAAPEKQWPTAVLKRSGVKVDNNDLVKVARKGRVVKGTKRKVRQGDRVRLIDVRKRIQTKRVKVDPRTVEQSTTKLKPGRRKVVARGKAGVQRVKARRTTHNGELVKYEVVKRTTLKKAQPRRVLVGRKAATVPGTGGLNWGALARCESGGNPRAVNAAGYYGLYQFNVGTWNSVGGSGMPHHASAAEQTLRAKILYGSRGAQPWPYCGRFL